VKVARKFWFRRWFGHSIWPIAWQGWAVVIGTYSLTIPVLLLRAPPHSFMSHLLTMTLLVVGFGSWFLVKDRVEPS